MKKLNKKMMIKIAGGTIVAALLAAIVFFLYKYHDLLVPSKYDANAPTQTKFINMSRWIPASSEFDITIDVPRALANEDLRLHIAKAAQEKTGVASELFAALLAHDEAVGLITVVGAFGNKDETPKLAVLVQGRFDEKILLPAIRTVMSAGRAGLSAQELGWATLYTESNEREPFGFIILDNQHIAIGSRDALLLFYAEKPALVESVGRLSDSTIFGHAVIGSRLKSFMPPTLQIPESVDFSSTIGQTLIAIMRFANQEDALNTKMFLEGIRALIMLQQEQNIPLAETLKGISITNAANEVTISTEIPPLLNLW